MGPVTTRAAARTLRWIALASLAAGLPALGGCSHGPEATGSFVRTDVRERHPIVLTDGRRIIDVFVEGPTGLVVRGRRDVAAYMAEYRSHGSGPMIAQVPTGPGANPGTWAALRQIEAAAGRALTVSTYQPTDPKVASPIRLTFRRLQAKVGSQCGLWPEDLGVSDPGRDWHNQQYWNFGCATQANLASQVADPVDLVRPRQETPPDTGRRMFNFEQIRKGEDPSTNWKDQNQTVRQAVSQ